MADAAHQEAIRSGGGPPEGPRFSLRFDERGGVLALARPFAFRYGLLEELELGLGRLRFPLDLSAGPSRFRTRRTHVLRASVRVELAEVLDGLIEEPFSLRSLGPADDGMGFALRDAFGTVAFDADARFEGSTLRLAAHEARAVLDAPAPPLARVALAARALGLAHEDERGAWALPRALTALLREALVPFGWRQPDDRNCRLALEWLGPRRFRVRTLAVEDDEPADGSARWEAVERLAPVVAQLASGDEPGARILWESVRERGASEPSLRRAASLGFAAVDEGPLGASIGLRQALREGAAERAAALAERFAADEPCDALAVEALCAAADLGSERHARLAAGLLERAVARRPSDARVTLRLVEVLARLGLDDELERATAHALATREPGPGRGAMARDAAAVCALAGQHGQADALYRIAAAHLPTDPDALEGAGGAAERAGDLEAALDRFDRAAARHGEEGHADASAHALHRAAKVAERLGRLEAAETRWTRASRVRPTADVFASLARLRRDLGEEEAATRAEDRLLERLGAEPTPSLAALDAVADVARRALDEGAYPRAKAWLAALRRAGDHGAVAELEAALVARDADHARAEPSRLLSLEPARLVAVLDGVEDPSALLSGATAASADRGAAMRLWAEAAKLAEGPLARALAEEATSLREHASGAERLLDLEPLVTTPDARGDLAEAAWEQLKEAGRPVEAARAQARAGAAKRDTAMLRAALSAAERAGDTEAALEIAQLALTVVGSPAARRALEAVIRRLRGE